MLTAESFCKGVWGFSYEQAQKQIEKTQYREFLIPKKGGIRKISYVLKDSSLWNLQQKLLIKFLAKQPVPICVKGFIKGENYHSFLAQHVGAEYFLRIDVSEFFSSITAEWVKHTFNELLQCENKEEQVKLTELLCDIVILNNVLPQGASTSPAVSNLVMARLDQRITKYCQLFNVRYTRYADDLLFSSRDFDFEAKKWFLKKIKYILGTQKLKVNYSKLKHGQKEMVLNGYVIGETGVRLSRKRLEDIRHVVIFARDNGYLLKHRGPQAFLAGANQLQLKQRDLTKHPFRTIFQFVQYMCGYRAFLISLLDANETDTTFQKDLRKLISKIEKQVDRLA